MKNEKEKQEALIDAAVKKEKEKQDALQFGTFFTPIDKVWLPSASKYEDWKHAFAAMRREEGYYSRVDEYNNIVGELRAQATAKAEHTSTDTDRLAEAMAEWDFEGGGSKVKSAVSKKKSKKVRRSNTPKAIKNDDDPSDVSGMGSDPSVVSGSGSSASVTQSSNISTGSGKIRDCFGHIPSSRAHMVPDSGCYPSYGVSCSAALGVSGGDQKFLRNLAQRMQSSRFNLLRAPGVHGEWYDAKPAWIFVPICERNDIINWDPKTPYWAMAIAGGWGECQNPVSVEDAYSSLCVFPYNNEDHIRPLMKCDGNDIQKATDRLSDMVLALADTLLDAGEDTITPLTLQDQAHGGNGGSVQSSRHGSGVPKAPPRDDKKVTVLKNAIAALKKDGVKVPMLKKDINLESLELVKFLVNPEKVDLYPDPWLLLMKAAINWSWRCGQKLYPACRSVHSEEEEEEEWDVPSTPVPTIIECGPLPVTPDFGDAL